MNNLNQLIGAMRCAYSNSQFKRILKIKQLGLFIISREQQLNDDSRKLCGTLLRNVQFRDNDLSLALIENCSQDTDIFNILI